MMSTFRNSAKRVALWLVVRCSPKLRNRLRLRKDLAALYLRGIGVEIGALHMPLSLPAGVRVRYLDRAPVNEQRRMYPELALLPLVPVDLVDDAERLASVADDSVDFLVANHVIEHTENPIAALHAWLRVVRPKGILYFAVPDKRYTFDRHRPLTTLAHVHHDFAEGPGGSRYGHVEEIVRVMENLLESEIPRRVEQLLQSGESPHYHVWTDNTFRELLQHCRCALRFPFSIEEIRPVSNEFVVILRKTIVAPSQSRVAADGIGASAYQPASPE